MLGKLHLSPTNFSWQVCRLRDIFTVLKWYKTAFDAAEQGDPDAKEVLDTYFGYLATGLVNIINIFQPDVLCIGGGISNQGENLLRPLRKIIEEERYTKHNDKQTILCTCTLGNDAGIIGAAFLD